MKAYKKHDPNALLQQIVDWKQTHGVRGIVVLDGNP